ncbi:MAG: cyclopropane-fatty-acyl-phospholipid synthase family protein [Pseudomonadota bacterium]|nr:cyclopropane-fatty-acyl-phospholipid synthase family protein [Pseudomonadota bacterium]MEC7831176.1 cyclopropane-fatty-acyl-phospholipid synthase family protein [Pseudomonadota bacterium]MEC9481224.1 cyclopropane-fatty-acyl-phospholipid synthase family protein [Pseudomonadota bacterium]
MINIIIKRYIDKIGSKIKFGKLIVVMPNGDVFIFKGKKGIEGKLILKSYKAIIRTILGGHLGFSESYLNHEWESPNLEKLLELMLKNLPNEFQPKSRLYKFYNRFVHFLRDNNKIRAKKNIEYHYDIGNSFYEIWLDKSMTYSSGIFQKENEDLFQAQKNKYEKLIKKMDIKPHHKVLEIGCGWGGMAEYIGKNLGCDYTGITISPSQKEFTEKRMITNKIEEKTNIKLCDYRDIKGKFDRIISIEMIEAVGEKYWDTYFSKINNCLKKGGLAGIQMILIDNQKFNSYRKSVDFIQKYIFPGGMLPSQEKIRDSFTKNGLLEISTNSFGKSYAKTLKIWRNNFNSSLDKLAKIGIDTRIQRLFHYYFSYCEAGFSDGQINVSQKIIKKA